MLTLVNEAGGWWWSKSTDPAVIQLECDISYSACISFHIKPPMPTQNNTNVVCTVLQINTLFLIIEHSMLQQIILGSEVGKPLFLKTPPTALPS